jgi:hypothetical protein
MNRDRVNRDYTDLLAAVHAEGGAVSVERWKVLGAEHGYVPARTLNGLFGGLVPSMRKDGDQRVLTEKGRSRI